MHDTVQKTLAAVLENNAKEGTYRVARDIFTDPEIFELEMKHIFEGNWIYLAHESQIPNKNDYLQTYIRPPAHHHRPQRAWRVERVHQCLCPSRRLALPAQTREPSDLYLPLPWLDL